jgi:glycosyltransferase involved in cell wall biosynthesis
MKILFIHYSYKIDGVTRVVLNNIKGLATHSNELKFIVAGDAFEFPMSEEIDQRYIDWNAEDIFSQLQKISQDADVIIIENPTIGIFPRATLAFKKFSENNPDKKIIYRIHDFVEDRPFLLDNFKKICGDLNKIYPQSSNVSFLTLTSFDKKRLINKGVQNVSVLPNSIIVSDFETDKERAFKLRKTFEDNGIINPEEIILTYPVRVLRRKNIEEAILLTKLMNKESTQTYRLIVTIPFEKDYENEIENLAKEYDVPCSIGKTSKYLSFDKKEKYTIADLYLISDLVISTSVCEGFGLAFVEPWLAGTPVIGRKINSVTEDFENNGIDLTNLYDNSIFHNSKDSKERMSNVIAILSNPKKFEELSKRLDMFSRIKKAKLSVEKNKLAIEKNYNHLNVAKQLWNRIVANYD